MAARKPSGGPKPRRRGPRKTYQVREVERLAEKGVSQIEDIAAALDIPADIVASDRKRLREAIARGNGRHRVAVAKRVFQEGVGKGRSHALLASARHVLGFDQPKPDLAGAPDDAEARVRLRELLSKYREQHPQEPGCRACGGRCPKCSRRKSSKETKA